MMLFLSAFEGYGIPPSEAMYCERLCIAYDLPILRMIYKNHLLYAPQGDYKAVAELVRENLKNKSKKRKHIESAKNYIDKIVDYDRVRDDFLKIVGYSGEKIIDVEKLKDVNLSFLSRKRLLTFGIIVCNGDQFLLQQLDHIYDMADQIVICEGAVEGYNKIIGRDYSTDKTLDMIRDFRESRDLKKKIDMVSCKQMGRAWKDKMEMQNEIAKRTKGTIFVKQDVDEFYNLEDLNREINRLEREKGKLMINYQSLHFWDDFNHVIKGANFNDKQTRVWKWRPSYRYIQTFNWVTDTISNQYIPPETGNMFVSEKPLYHYSYIYKHKERSNILKYYSIRTLAKDGSGNHKDVATAWSNRNPDAYLMDGRKVVKVDVRHPVSDQILQSFIK
jgi:hypothetical protein